MKRKSMLFAGIFVVLFLSAAVWCKKKDVAVQGQKPLVQD